MATYFDSHPADTLISDMDEYTVPEFIVALRDDPNLNDVSMGTYARDFVFSIILWRIGGEKSDYDNQCH